MDTPVTSAPTTIQVNGDEQKTKRTLRGACGDCGACC